MEQGRMERAVVGLLQGWGITIGLVLLGSAAVLHKTADENTYFIIGAYFCAEVGAVAISITTIHLIYHRILHREADRLRSLLDDGVEEYHPELTTAEFSGLLSRSRVIKVVKTFFPEDPHLEEGIQKALRNKKAKITIHVLHPDSSLLEARSLSIGKSRTYGRDKVIEAIQNMYKWKFVDHSPGTIHLCLFDSWPPPPIICLNNETTYLGFYFLNSISPQSPWVQIKAKSRLDLRLMAQLEAINCVTKLATEQEFLTFMRNRHILPVT